MRHMRILISYDEDAGELAEEIGARIHEALKPLIDAEQATIVEVLDQELAFAPLDVVTES